MADPSSYKLNTDGPFSSVGLACGGVILDERGEFIAGFASSYDHIDIVSTELTALIDGIQLARDLGITSYTVEVDSSIVFNMVRRHGIIHWRHIYFLRHL